MIIQYSAIPVITEGNLLFRDKIIINTSQRIVSYRKRSINIIGYTLRTLRFKDIAEVQLIHRREFFIFSRVNIITFGGSVVTISGLKPADAKNVKYILDNMR